MDFATEVSLCPIAPPARADRIRNRRADFLKCAADCDRSRSPWSGCWQFEPIPDVSLADFQRKRRVKANECANDGQTLTCLFSSFVDLPESIERQLRAFQTTF